VTGGRHIFFGDGWSSVLRREATIQHEAEELRAADLFFVMKNEESDLVRRPPQLLHTDSTFPVEFNQPPPPQTRCRESWGTEVASYN
jgi:hypothetical protein